MQAIEATVLFNCYIRAAEVKAFKNPSPIQPFRLNYRSMKRLSITILFFLIQNMAAGQDKLVKDLDHDGIQDSVHIESARSVIVCKLSTQKFKAITSKVLEIVNETSGVKATKSGFEYYNAWMRAGFHNQFRFNKKAKKIQLIGMSRYEFGSASNDGSGESSVNLLTGNYIGNWNYYDMEKEELISLPAIVLKMSFKPVYLEAFEDDIYFDYGEKCAELFHAYQEKSRAQRR
jgi:hypothetical protein